MNNRELATLLLLAAVVLSALWSKKIRGSLAGVARALTHWRILISLVALALWIGVAVAIAYASGVWTADFTFATAAWYLSAAAWLANLREAGNPGYIRSRLRGMLTLGVVLAFFMNLYVFSLPVEFVGQFLLTGIALLNVVAASDEKYAPVARITGGILLAATVGLVAFSVWQLTEGWRATSLWSLLTQLTLPVWLTIWTVPFVYASALFAGYEILLVRVKNHTKEKHLRPATTAGLVTALGVSNRRVWGFTGPGLSSVAQAPSFREVRRAVLGHEASVREEQQAKEAARTRLLQYAGVTGVDDNGLQLDRREFRETKRALEWIATCHEGWYSRSNRYRPDLLRTVLSDLSAQGISGNHGVQMRVRQDGQAWYAYRQAPNGYWFGVGMTQHFGYWWYWDGQEAPRTWPSRKRGWTIDIDERPEWSAEAPT